MTTDDRIAALERQVAELTQIVIMRGQEIERLRQELDAEVAQRAIESLRAGARR
jgi:hypothetical protein